jgi:hypothetical protein
VKQRVREIVNRSGFSLNAKKTRVQNANSGRREICGVMVDDEIHISRYHRRKLRGMQHRLQYAEGKEKTLLLRKIRGLEEFSKLKTPKGPAERLAENIEKTQLSEAQKIASQFGLRPPVPVKKSIQPERLGENMEITNDPAYFYGMSAFTPGWTSCMSVHSTHNYRRGVAFFQRLPGCSLAILTGQKKKVLAGVERPEMIARCLVFQLRSGEKMYGKFYGHETDTLKDALKKAGYKSSVHGEVVGNVKKPCALPYFDYGRATDITVRIAGKTKKALKMVL